MRTVMLCIGIGYVCFFMGMGVSNVGKVVEKEQGWSNAILTTVFVAFPLGIGYLAGRAGRGRVYREEDYDQIEEDIEESGQRIERRA